MPTEHSSESEYDAVRDTALWTEKFLGKIYEFDDGDKLEIIQVRRRDDGPWITYLAHQGPGIPRKLMMRVDAFIEAYGHLFEN